MNDISQAGENMVKLGQGIQGCGCLLVLLFTIPFLLMLFL